MSDLKMARYFGDMSSAHRVIFRIVLGLALLSGAVNMGIFAVAFVGLSNGPSVAGWEALANANHLAPFVAGLAAVAVIVRAFHAEHSVVPAAGLFLASGITAAVAGGLYAMGKLLVSFDNATVIDSTQPNAGLDLNSLLLGIQGSGQDLAAVPVVLAIAAATILVLRSAGRFSPLNRNAVVQPAS